MRAGEVEGEKRQEHGERFGVGLRLGARPFCFLVVVAWSAFVWASDAPTWKAGLARVAITPEKPVWLSGYSGKRIPTGKLHDLWVKVLAIEDADGRRAVLVTSDVIGFSKAAYDSLSKRVEERFRFDRSRLLLTFSHTHSGPVLRESLIDYFPLDAAARKLITDYSSDLEDKIVETIGRAIEDLKPARLEAGEGTATFAVNRRNNREADIAGKLARGEALAGPVDHSVPVLVVRGQDNGLRAVVFGYACHNTTLAGLEYCGDYAGFAQIELESSTPGVQAMFWSGCGADQNPLPRRDAELCEKYGRMLAEGVRGAMRAGTQRIEPTLKTAFANVELRYEKVVPRETLEADAKARTADGQTTLRSRWAERLLERMDRGEPLATRGSYDYPVVVWRLGRSQLWIALGGEVVVDFALRFKARYGAGTWVAAYTNDLVAYIPSRRVWVEGGYEGAGVYEYGLPAERWSADVEERIIEGVSKLSGEVTKE